jgi:putative transposase
MSTQILKAYKVRLYPTDEQQIFFAKSFGCSRFIWNKMLSDKRDYYQIHKEALNNTPAQYKAEFEWLKEVDSLALANVQQNLTAAYRKFFKGAGFPKFKKKGLRDSYTTNNQKGTVAVTDSAVKLPKIGHIRAKFPNKINGLIKSVTIIKTPSGKYFVSLLVETVVEKLQKTKINIGIDLGLTNFIVLSDGMKVANPKFLSKLQDRLAREQKILAKRRLVAKAQQRKLSESRNYQKQKTKVAKVYEKITNSRKDFLHKLSFNIIKNHDVIAIEDLNVKGMVKNRKLAKAISDSSWSAFTTMLVYKSDWYGKTLVKIDRWYPSSKTCSNCNHLLTNAQLSVRSWDCPSCVQTNQRDINASINILTQGLMLVKQSKTVGATGLA